MIDVFWYDTGWAGKKVKSSTVDKISSTALCELTKPVFKDKHRYAEVALQRLQLV